MPASRAHDVLDVTVPPPVTEQRLAILGEWPEHRDRPEVLAKW